MKYQTLAVRLLVAAFTLMCLTSAAQYSTALDYPSSFRKVSNEIFSTQEEYADFDLETEFMVQKNTNAALLLQGRYALLFSEKEGIVYPTHPPRQKIGRAAGLWQRLKISFQAARFDSAGRKTSNAKIISLDLNGIQIYENLEVTAADEVAAGPLVIRNNKDGILFRNLSVKRFNGLPPILMDIHYSVYYDKFEEFPEQLPLKADEEGTLRELTTSFIRRETEFLVRYTGNVLIRHPEEYIFQRETYGKGRVTVNGIRVSDADTYDTKPIRLEPGVYPFEILYSKPVIWLPMSLGLTISAPGIREFLASEHASLYREYPDPILIDASAHTVHRSFMDLPDGKRIVHAVNVGTPQRLHYSYDMDNGMIFQVWRGEFLDATPMWHSRGDGSSKATGSLIYLGEIGKTILGTDTLLTPGGYEIDGQKTVFLYRTNGAEVQDAIEASAAGDELKRVITVNGNASPLTVKLAEGKTIEKAGKNTFLVDDRTYYIKIEKAESSPVISELNGRQILTAPIRNQISYSIQF